MPWPILIKNLRLSCANDWRTATEAPAPAIAAWTGHGVTVQDSAYATVSGGHLEEFNAKKTLRKVATQVATNPANRRGRRRIRVVVEVVTSREMPVINEKSGFLGSGLSLSKELMFCVATTDQVGDQIKNFVLCQSVEQSRRHW